MEAGTVQNASKSGLLLETIKEQEDDTSPKNASESIMQQNYQTNNPHDFRHSSTEH